MSTRDESRRPRHLVPALGIAAAFFVLGAVLFPAAGRDDLHITCWAARSLGETGEIINYNGDRIEQSSSLLHVLVLAILHAVTGWDTVALSRVVAVIFGYLTVIMVFLLASGVGRTAAVTAATVLAGCPFFLYWSFGGLETSLFAFCLSACVLEYARFLDAPALGWRRVVGSGSVSILVALARPEAPLVVICALMGLLLLALLKARRGPEPGAAPDCMRPSRVSSLLLTAVFACAAVTAFRLYYFNDAVPQPVHAKSAGLSARHVGMGLNYLATRLLKDPTVAPLSILALIGAVLVLKAQIRGNSTPKTGLLLATVFAGVYLLFIALVGGDWMESARFPAHVAPLLALLAAFAIAAPGAAHRIRIPALGVLGVVLVIQTCGILRLAAGSSMSVPVWSAVEAGSLPRTSRGPCALSWFERHNRVNIRDAIVMERLGSLLDLAVANGSPVTVMSGQMGMVPYKIARAYRGRVRWFDRFGVTDTVLTDCSETALLPRSPLGVAFPYELYFANGDIIEKSCGIALPDIIFDRFVCKPSLLIANGYRIVYAQGGTVRTASRYFPGASLKADQFIAVREPLADKLGIAGTEFVRF